MNNGTTKFQIKRRGNKTLYTPGFRDQALYLSEYKVPLEFTLNEALNSNLPDEVKARLKSLTPGRVISLHKGRKLSISLLEGNVKKNLANKRLMERIAATEKRIEQLQKQLASDKKKLAKNI